MKNAAGLSVILYACSVLLLSADQQIPPREDALRNAITAGGTITFSQGGTITLREPLRINTDVVIDGTGAAVVISGDDASRVIEVGAATVTLRNLTISRGRAAFGGGLLNEGNLTVIDCKFIGNTAQGADGEPGVSNVNTNALPGDNTPGGNGAPGESAWGGAIYNTGTLVIFDSEFRGNSAAAGAGGSGGRGGYGYNFGYPAGNGAPGGEAAGGAIVSIGTLTASNVVFIENAATGGGGGNGGIGGSYVWTGGGTHGSGGSGGAGGSAAGGALFVRGSAQFIGARFTDNTARAGSGGNGASGGGGTYVSRGGDAGSGAPGGYGRGGAVHVDDGAASFDLCIFTGSRVTGGDGGTGAQGGSDIIMGAQGDGANGGSAQGAALSVQGGSVSVSQSTLRANAAAAGNGGAGANAFSFPNGRFSPSSGGASGSGGDADGTVFNAGAMTITACTIAANTIQAGDGARGGNGGTPRTVSGSAGGNGGAGGSCSGGGICNRGALQVVNSTLTANELHGGAGAAGGNSGRALMGYEHIRGGDGGAGGHASGGAVCSADGGQTTLLNVTIANNTAASGAGAAGGNGSSTNDNGTAGADGELRGQNVAAMGGTLSIQNSILASSRAEAQSAGSISDEGYNLCSDSSCGFTQATSLNATDARLAELADNAGPTQTMALRDGSPAIDAANAGTCPAVDQRGFARPAGPGCDIGAFESGASLPDPGGLPGYMITGRVTDGTNGIAGVRVRMARMTTYTDESGAFSFEVAKPKRYVVSVRDKRFRFRPAIRRVNVRESITVPDFVGRPVRGRR